ncbi:hypothetical protein Aperf_G00000116421 [Anoplocephala perfoliata]
MIYNHQDDIQTLCFLLKETEDFTEKSIENEEKQEKAPVLQTRESVEIATLTENPSPPSLPTPPPPPPNSPANTAAPSSYYVCPDMLEAVIFLCGNRGRHKRKDLTEEEPREITTFLKPRKTFEIKSTEDRPFLLPRPSTSRSPPSSPRRHSSPPPTVPPPPPPSLYFPPTPPPAEVAPMESSQFHVCPEVSSALKVLRRDPDYYNEEAPSKKEAKPQTPRRPRKPKRSPSESPEHSRSPKRRRTS